MTKSYFGGRSTPILTKMWDSSYIDIINLARRGHKITPSDLVLPSFDNGLVEHADGKHPWTEERLIKYWATQDAKRKGT